MTDSQNAYEPSDKSADVAPRSWTAWAVPIFVPILIGWVLYSFPPTSWKVPDRLSNVGALSPQSEQDELAAVENAILWKNSLFMFGLAGLSIGLAGFLFHGSSATKHLVQVIAVLCCGAASGLVAATLGILLRQYFDQGFPIPLIGAASRPLFCDGAVLTLISILLLLPIALLLCMQPSKEEKQKGFAVPLAGLLAGVLSPIVCSIVSPNTSTSIFPPYGFAFTISWFVLMALMTTLVVAFMGQKEAKPSPDNEPASHNG